MKRELPESCDCWPGTQGCECLKILEENRELGAVRTWAPAKGTFSSIRPNWRTPEWLYAKLNDEFAFTLDPCGPQGWDGLFRSWAGERVYCNPPYSRAGMEQWLSKAREADLAVFLVASRTGSEWWHRYALDADEIRFIRGRLRFDNSKINAPFDSAILVFRGGA